jgi:hypothetical protein
MKFEARIKENQSKINRLMLELAYAQRCADAYGIRSIKRDLIVAKKYDKMGQMA